MAQLLVCLAVSLLLSLAGANDCVDASQSSCSATWPQTEADDALTLLQLRAQMVENESEQGVCAIYGNPNITSFDGKTRNKYLTAGHTYSGGDTWIVKNSQIQIQGRYIMVKNATESYLRMIAVGGPFLDFNGSNKLLIEANGKKSYWNNKKILNHAGTTFQNDIVSAKYNHESVDVVHPEQHVKIPGIDVTLPMGVKLLVNRAENGLEMRLTMPRAKDGQDGECGNFNGNKTDDTVPLIKNRTSVKIEFEEMLLPKPKVHEMLKSKSASEEEIVVLAEDASDKPHAKRMGVHKMKSKMMSKKGSKH